MRTSTFIEKHARLIEQGEREGNTSGHAQCASVMRDGDRIYSYGYHYPLLMRVQAHDGKMLWVRNDAGYSSTTGKHICWAGAVSDIDAPVGTARNGAITRDDIVGAIAGRIEKLRTEMATKKRTDTQVYRGLEQSHARAMGHYTRLTGNTY